MKGVVGWAGISGVLFETATRDLSAINGSTHISTSSSLVET